MSQSGISKEFVDAIRSVDPAATMWLHPDVQLAICIRPSDARFERWVTQASEGHRPMGVMVQIVPWDTPYGIGLPVPRYRPERWWKRLYRRYEMTMDRLNARFVLWRLEFRRSHPGPVYAPIEPEEVDLVRRYYPKESRGWPRHFRNREESRKGWQDLVSYKFVHLD